MMAQATNTRAPRRWLPYAAGLWSLACGALGLIWASGGAGFPYGNRATDDAGLSPLAALSATRIGPVIAVWGLLGAVVALAMAWPRERVVPRPLLLAFGWVTTAVLLLLVPDARLLTFVGYLPALVATFGFASVDWPVVRNQFVCVIGGILWGGATLTFQRATGKRPSARVANGGASPWGRWVTYAAAALPLPYAATRLAWAIGLPLGIDDALLAQLRAEGAVAAEVSLGGMALAGGLLTLGLGQRWGEVFPRWLPMLGGTRVPPALAIIPATLAAVALTVGGFSLYRTWLVTGPPVAGAGWGAYLPPLLFLPWGIALGLATVAYAERRRATDAGGVPGLP
jgi:hypothetical protein